MTALNMKYIKPIIGITPVVRNLAGSGFTIDSPEYSISSNTPGQAIWTGLSTLMQATP